MKRSSIRDISRLYFGAEYAWALVVELLIFAILTASAIWPIVNAAATIQRYLL